MRLGRGISGFYRLLLLATFAIRLNMAQDAGEQEFSPYVFTYSKLPFKHTNYARDWFGYDIAYIQNPLLAPGKPVKKHHRVPLPATSGQLISWSNLGDVSSNQENTWNFEKRVDSKVWWPN